MIQSITGCIHDALGMVKFELRLLKHEAFRAPVHIIGAGNPGMIGD
jgi:hypothetical protein